MRCPKCGYTSFDNLERCKKCKKNIGAAAAALMGTVAEAAPPAFLRFAEPERQPDSRVEALDDALNLDIGDDSALDHGETEDELFSFDGENQSAESTQSVPEFAADDSGIDLRLNDSFEPKPLKQEPVLDIELDLGYDEEGPLAADRAEAKSTAPHAGLALAGLDISDLQAPQSETSQEIKFEGPALSLVDDSTEPDPAVVPESRKNAALDFSLEDLEVADLGVEKSNVSGSDTRYQPPTKTGTALDSFNFELDELLEADENEKA